MKTRILTLLLLSMAMVACNTVAGVGKDIKKAGSTIEKAAQ